MAKIELTTVPNFEFRQGTHREGTFADNPIKVEFYQNCITLKQEGGFDQDEEVTIAYEYLGALFKAIKSVKMEAISHLNK